MFEALGILFGFFLLIVAAEWLRARWEATKHCALCNDEKYLSEANMACPLCNEDALC